MAVRAHPARAQPDATAFSTAYRQTMRLRNEFYDHARKDLDITSGPSPELSWKSLQPWTDDPANSTVVAPINRTDP